MLFNPECCPYLEHEILTLLSSAIGIHTFFYKVVNAIKNFGFSEAVSKITCDQVFFFFFFFRRSAKDNYIKA